ncbi:MAG: thiamine phosphate synthase [Rhodospirillales bacterium]|nr:thiamine phosphate synthase [Rhodospirillales bacterium]
MKVPGPSRLPRPPILLITDRKQCPESLEARAAALFRGGCRFLSLREKDMAPDERTALLGRLAALGRECGATVCVHDDIVAARACGTALHLPADGETARTRRLLGPDVLIGQSCHSRAEILAAAAGGADYVTMGPVFATASKPVYAPAENLTDAMAGIRLPILALGGITRDMLRNLPVGFSGLAVMGAAMTEADPEGWFAEIEAGWRELDVESG